MASILNNGINTNLTSDLASTPVAGDVVVIAEGDVSYVAGVDLSATDLLGFEVRSTSGMEVEAALPLKLQLNRTGTGRFLNQGRGRLIHLEGATAATVINEVRHEPVNSTGQLHLGAANVQEAACRSGLLVLKEPADVNMLTAGATGVVRALNGAIALGTVVVGASARVDLFRDVGTIGNLGRLLIDHDDVSPVTWDLWGEAEVRAHGAVTTLNLYGTLDLTGADENLVVTTLTSYPGSVVRRRHGGPGLSVTTDSSIAGGYREVFV